MADLSTPLDRLLGGPTAKKLASSRDLHTVADLLGFLPRRYLDPATTTDLSTSARGRVHRAGGDGEERDDPADAAAPGDDADGHRDRRHPRHDADVLQALRPRGAPGAGTHRAVRRQGAALPLDLAARAPQLRAVRQRRRRRRARRLRRRSGAGLPRRAQARLVGHHQVDADRLRPPRRHRRPGAGRGAPRAARWTACSRPTGWSTCPGTAGTSPAASTGCATTRRSPCRRCSPSGGGPTTTCAPRRAVRVRAVCSSRSTSGCRSS